MISCKFSQSPSSRLILAYTRWLVTVAVEAVAVVGVAAVVAEEAEEEEDVVVCQLDLLDMERSANEVLGWTGGNSDPVRNSRW